MSLPDLPQIPDQVAELTRRVDELEQRARPGDTLQPNYLTVDPTGKIGAAFTGHLAAAGVDLEASDQFNDGPDRKIRWLDAKGGLVASIGAYETSSYEDPLLVLYGARNATSGQTGEVRVNTEGTSGAELLVRASDATGGYGQVSAIVAGQQRTILDDRGLSDFAVKSDIPPPYKPPFNYTQIYAGQVTQYFGTGSQFTENLNFTPWPNAHLAFICDIEATVAWNGNPPTLHHGSGPTGPGSGFCLFDNGIAQNIIFSFISIGY